MITDLADYDRAKRINNDVDSHWPSEAAHKYNAGTNSVDGPDQNLLIYERITTCCGSKQIQRTFVGWSIRLQLVKRQEEDKIGCVFTRETRMSRSSSPIPAPLCCRILKRRTTHRVTRTEIGVIVLRSRGPSLTSHSCAVLIPRLVAMTACTIIRTT